MAYDKRVEIGVDTEVRLNSPDYDHLGFPLGSALVVEYLHDEENKIVCKRMFAKEHDLRIVVSLDRVTAIL